MILSLSLNFVNMILQICLKCPLFFLSNHISDTCALEKICIIFGAHKSFDICYNTIIRNVPEPYERNDNMSTAMRHYERKDFSYLLIDADRIHSDKSGKPEHDNIAGLNSETYSRLKECCKNKKERYSNFTYLLSRLSYSKELLNGFLKLSPVIREVRYDHFCFTAGSNDWRFSAVTDDTADLFIRLSRITADGRKQFTGERLFFTGKIDEIFRRLSDGIPDQHCCKPPKAKPKNAEQSEVRKALLGNAGIWYIKDLRSETVHEKSCPLIANIPDEESDGVKRLDPDYKLCPCCYRASLIRLVIGESARYLNAYVRFFETLRIRYDRLYQLTAENRTELSFPSPDTNLLRAHVNDDTWLIERHPDNTVTLWHNDYQVLEDDTRYFTGGFHVQLDGASVNVAVSVMCHYSWADHIAKRTAVNDIVPVPVITAEPEAPAVTNAPEHVGFLRRIFQAVRGFLAKFAG